MSGVPRILIVRVGAMGDVLHALPAVAALRAALPQAHLGWAIEPRWAPLLRVEGTVARDAERMPLVDRVHLVEAKRWNRAPLSRATWASVTALRAALRAERYDFAVDLQGTLRSAAIARIGSGAPTIGSASPREGLARLFYRDPIHQEQRHVVDRAMGLVATGVRLANGIPLAVEVDLPFPLREETAPVLPRDRAAEAWWARERVHLLGERAPVLLAATAGWGAKEWPPEKFAALAAALVERGYGVLLNTTPEVVDPVTVRVLAHVRAAHGDAAAHVHPLQATLPQLIAATRGMRVVVAGDTGPLHLAALLGVPTVGLFGPTDPARTGPREVSAVNLRDAASVTDHRRFSEAEAGLRRITVETVLEAVGRVG